MKTHVEMMASYNAWANVRLFRMAGALADDLYRKDVGAYFKSLHGTLNHLLVADRIWMYRLTGLGNQPNQLNATLCDDLPSLHAARVEEDHRILGFVQSLAEPAFEEVLEYRMLNGAPQRQRRPAGGGRGRSASASFGSVATSDRSPARRSGDAVHGGLRRRGCAAATCDRSVRARR